jgi:multidrug efflux system membrane fusion protein
VTGRVTEVLFAEGADVRAGDVLVKLDARMFEARLAAAEASLRSAQAALARAGTSTQGPKAMLERARAARDLARTELARLESLLGTKAVARADYDEKKASLAMMDAELAQAEANLRQAGPEEEEAAAAVKRAEAEVEMARLDVEYCTVKAPADGRAGKRLVDPGSIATANTDVLVVLQRIDPVYVDFTVPDREVAVVREHMRAGKLAVEARLPSAPDAPRTGELTFLENQVASATGTLMLRATFANPDRALWPGSFVQVRLVLSTIPGAVLIPSGAEGTSPQGTFVYVVKDDGTAEMRPITLGQRQRDLVVVASGLRAGERVVTVGQLGVTPGGKVHVMTDALAPHGPAAEPSK